MKALAFGDQQFLFRHLGLWLQGVGDGGGRIRPLREYDYTRVVSWLQSLDGLDPRSDYVPALAAHYFGAIMVDPGKVKVIVQYLVERAQSDLARGWPWLVWAAEKSMHVIKEKPLCSALAARFYGFRDSTEVPQVLAMFATPLYRCAEDKFMMLALQADPKMRALRQHAAEEMGALLAEHPF